jgi:hypothetical protein
MCHPQSQNIVVDPLESPLPPPFLKSFPTSIQSQKAFDPTVFEQTQALHYFSPILAHGLQILYDQFSVQHAFTYTILCCVYAPTPNKIDEFFSHRTTSCPSLSWPMHILALLSVPPWNLHVLKKYSTRIPPQ